MFIEPSLAVGPTFTAYPSTFIVTKSVDCGGCGALITAGGHVFIVSLLAFD